MTHKTRLLGGFLGIAMSLGLASAPLAHARAPAAMRASALEVQLTVHMTGLGRVTSEPAGIDCTNGTGMCNATFLADTSVNLTATPAAGYEPSQLASCFASTCTVSLGSAPQTIDAIFDVTSSLWLEVSGNGVVRATPLDVPPGTGEDGPMTCDIEGGTSPTPEFRDCQLRVAPGRRVLLELVRNVPGGTFIGWSDPDCPVQPTCTVVMPTAPSTPHDPVQPYDLTVAASFAPVPVGVIAAVVGGGHVSSTPAGMVCPPFVGDANPMRCVGFFPPGEIVTLHAGKSLVGQVGPPDVRRRAYKSIGLHARRNDFGVGRPKPRDERTPVPEQRRPGGLRAIPCWQSRIWQRPRVRGRHRLWNQLHTRLRVRISRQVHRRPGPGLAFRRMARRRL